MLRRSCLTIARLGAAIWVGAALLFVATSVTEQIDPAFELATKRRLALIRFPWYYGLGRPLLIVSGAAAAFAATGKPTRALSAGLLLTATVLMNVDYLLIYQPLRDAMQGGEAATFASLHRWSEWLNGGVFLLTAAAAVVLCAAREGGGEKLEDRREKREGRGERIEDRGVY